MNGFLSLKHLSKLLHVATQIFADHIFDLRHTLRYLGVSLEGPSWMFGYKLAVVNYSTLSSVKFQKRAHLLNYHQVMEAKSWGIIKIFHMDGKDNPADILTKFCSSREWYELLKQLIFWRASGEASGSHLITEGSVKLPLSALVTTST